MRAHLRPSAMAVTTSDWPTRASPQANTPGAEASYTGALMLPRASRFTSSCSSRPSCSGWEKPMAIRTRSAGSSCSVPGTGRRSRELVPSTRRARARVTRATREVAVPARADRDDHRVVAAAQLLGGDVAADVTVVDELHALLGQHVHAPVDDPLLQLGVGDPETQQPSRPLVALVHGDR